MLHTTVIMKTDIQGSTVQFQKLPEVDLGVALTEHRQLVSGLAEAHAGRVVKLEGDGFWIVFPSVTAAARAAMRMQEELGLAQPGKGDDRIAMRIVIVLGDVMHEEGALVGDAVVLATRIENVTPPDEIYLSAAAWLAMNQAEVRASPVDTFSLKGFPEPVAVYRVEQTHRMRVVHGQYIVVTDLRRFQTVMDEHPMAVVERILDRLLELVGRVCSESSGSHRSHTGDSYLLTFADAERAMVAAERLAEGWSAFQRAEGLRCSMNVAVHKGDLYTFRSYLLSRDVNVAFNVESVTSRLALDDNSVFLTGQVRKDLAGTPWDERVHAVEGRPTSPWLAGIEIYRLGSVGLAAEAETGHGHPR